MFNFLGFSKVKEVILYAVIAIFSYNKMNCNNEHTELYEQAIVNGDLVYTQEPVYKNTSYKNVCIHKFIDPSDFYVTVNENWKNISLALEDAVDEFIRYFGQAKKLKMLTYGMPVMAPKETSPLTYARGQVVNVNGLEVFVRLIDHGIFLPVKKESLRMISKDLLAIPKYLYSCRLQNTFPCIGVKWEKINWIEYLAATNIALHFMSEDTFGVYDVQLEVNKISFGANLINAGVAKPGDLNIIRSSGPYPVYEYSSWEKCKVPAFVVSVESMEVAWLQFHTTAMNEIVAAISVHINSMTNTQRNNTFLKLAGDPCLVFCSKNDIWRRGQILEVFRFNLYRVLLVDYGHIAFVNNFEITEIPENLINLPKASVKVKIKDVLGIEDTAQLAKLKDLIELKKLVACIEDTGNDTCGKEILIVSVWLKDGTSLSTYFSRSEIICEGEPMGFEEANSIYTNVMAGRTTEFYPGVEYKAVISYLESVESIWIQLGDSEQRALSMLREMQKFYTKSKLNMQMPPELVQPGVYCAAIFPSDLGWYRALIKEVSGRKVTVFYIDYGNDEVVPISCLKPLISYFARERSLAIEVALNATILRDNNDKNVDKVYNAILDFVQDGQVYVKLKNVACKNYASIKMDIRDIFLPMGMFDKTQFMECGNTNTV